jgi:hypothetical protein
VRHDRTGLLPRVMTRRHPQVPTIRTRLSAGDRRPRRGVRLLVCSPRSPWPAPFPPPPPPVPWGNLCSQASSVLWSGPTPYLRASRSYPSGSPCGPGDCSPGQRQGLPGSAHRVSRHARGLRPRQVRLPLATTRATVLPSACSERVGTQDSPDFGAPDSACIFPCQRFADTVTSACA